MRPVSIPALDTLTGLAAHRGDATVSIYLSSSPNPRDSDAVRLALKNALSDASSKLSAANAESGRSSATARAISSIDDDDEFWRFQGVGLGILAAPGILHVFRLPNRVAARVVVGDRFDLGPLIHSAAAGHTGHVLTITESAVRLFELSETDHPTELVLPALPDDIHAVFERAENAGQLDTPRAAGATGQRIEQQRYCRLVQEAVLSRIGATPSPLILAASHDLDPAYRAINSHPGLLERGIDAHPDSLHGDDIGLRAREILDDRHRAELAAWRERFGTSRSNGRATSDLKEVAFAATTAAIAELLVDLDASLDGEIDDHGVVSVSPPAAPGLDGQDDEAGEFGRYGNAHGILHEIVIRVLRAGGSVLAVGSDDLPDSSPVAALLRYPV